MDEKSVILEAMKSAGKPLSNGEIAEMTKLEKKVVEKAMKKLKDENLIESLKRCFWTIK